MFWWLSFADPSAPAGAQFIGACVVEAGDFKLAVQTAWRLGCNPGGECQGLRCPAPPQDASCVGKLYRGEDGATLLSRAVNGPGDAGVRRF